MKGVQMLTLLMQICLLRTRVKEMAVKRHYAALRMRKFAAIRFGVLFCFLNINKKEWTNDNSDVDSGLLHIASLVPNCFTQAPNRW